MRYLDGDNDDETNDNLQTEIAQVHHDRDKMKRNRAGDKRNITSTNRRERHSRSREEESDEDISDDDISDNNDGLDDSEYDDEDVDDSLSTKSSRINHHRGRHQSSSRSNHKAMNDSSRPRSSVRNQNSFIFKEHETHDNHARTILMHTFFIFIANLLPLHLISSINIRHAYLLYDAS